MPKPSVQQIRDAILLGGGDRTVLRIIGLIDAWEAETQAVPADDLEQHNRDQRMRREAFVDSAHIYHFGGALDADLPPAGYREWLQGVRADAARRYPLHKRVPKEMDDPHASGYKWRLNPNYVTESGTEFGSCFEIQFSSNGDWHVNEHGALLTPARIRALAALLDDPWTLEESTEVES